jgi:heme-degrading monooxygenase HmoA
MSVRRIWHGWTKPEHADLYQELLHQEIFPGIEAKEIEGYQSVELFRRDLKEEVEFMTLMTFDSIESVIDFQGSDYEKAYVPASAKKLLSRWDKTASHFTAVEKRNVRI